MISFDVQSDYIYGLLELELYQMLIASVLVTAMNQQGKVLFQRIKATQINAYDFPFHTNKSDGDIFIFNPVALFAVRRKSFPFTHDKVTHFI